MLILLGMTAIPQLLTNQSLSQNILSLTNIKARIYISVVTSTVKDNLKFSEIKVRKNNFNLNKTGKLRSDYSYLLLFLPWQILQMTLSLYPPPTKTTQFLGYRVLNTRSCYFHYIFSKFDVNEKKCSHGSHYYINFIHT